MKRRHRSDTVQHTVDIVLLHACGPSQRQTAEELHRHRPALGQRSVGKIYLRFQENERVSDKPKQVAREFQVMLNAVRLCLPT